MGCGLGYCKLARGVVIEKAKWPGSPHLLGGVILQIC